jgi:tRNA-specific 2-thiouridylase
MVEKVAVAISGGVDSTVTALLLKQRGYEVVGVTLDFGCFKSNGLLAGAKDACDAIGIEHHIVKCESEFKTNVVDYFIDSYLAGKTPSPCPKCNREMKFKKLIEFAKSVGAEKLATGHYARMIKKGQVSELHRGVDKTKDQSYFLSMLRREYLDFIDFPLGGQTKVETRAIADKFGLSVAQKKDSQDICFVPDRKYIEFIKKHRPDCFKKGNIVFTDGTVFGEHNGIINFTVGQRKGLGVSHSSPLYVLEINKEKNEVIVGDEKHLYKREVRLSGVNILAEDVVKYCVPLEVAVKLRSASEVERGSVIIQEDGTAKIKLHEPSRAVTKGQLCTAYEGTRVVFGGWIE